MRHTRRFSASLGIALVVLATVGCSAPEPTPKPESLTVSRAGAVYLDAVCPVNDAWDTADVELDQLRLAVSRDLSPSTKKFSAAMTDVAEQSAIAKKKLTSPKRTWPAVADAPVAEVADTLETDRVQAQRVAKLTAAKAIAYDWAGAEEIGTAAAAARAALQLPADADSACAQWENTLDNKRTTDADE
ncbi:hypothetical protein ACFWHR_06840 [Leucobacter sp. NPDC058333]|uniref:hypothetical protein n=1 Tax=Leucobacter sp. NPDC058333 TaxID=3346450 RepID=UPI00364DC429